MGQWFTDSGTSNGPDSRSWLSISTTVEAGASVQFKYSLSCPIGDYLTFSLNNQIISQYDCQQVIFFIYFFKTNFLTFQMYLLEQH